MIRRDDISLSKISKFRKTQISRRKEEHNFKTVLNIVYGFPISSSKRFNFFRCTFRMMPIWFVLLGGKKHLLTDLSLMLFCLSLRMAVNKPKYISIFIVYQ